MGGISNLKNKVAGVCCAYQAFAALLVFLVVVAFFGGAAGPLQESTGADEAVSVDGLTLPATSGKIGHEDHFFAPDETDVWGSGSPVGWVIGDPKQSNCVTGEHYVRPESYTRGADKPLVSAGGCGSFGTGMTPTQERYYFNMRWDYNGRKNDYRHKKVILTNPKNNKKIVVSIEEYGPAESVVEDHGINSGATPEVYMYLFDAAGGADNPYTGNPDDQKGYATYAFAEDQSIKLGPLE